MKIKLKNNKRNSYVVCTFKITNGCLVQIRVFVMRVRSELERFEIRAQSIQVFIAEDSHKLLILFLDLSSIYQTRTSTLLPANC